MQSSVEEKTRVCLISRLHTLQGEKAWIQGWVSSLRSSGSIVFFELRDGTSSIPCVAVKNDIPEDIWKSVTSLTLESSIRVFGEVGKHPRFPIPEMHVYDVVIFQVAAPYPISKKSHGVDFLMDHRHLWLRSSRQRAIQRVRHTIIYAIFEYFDTHQFVKIDAPILTPNACEGTTTLFEVPYFEQKAYLSQSGQLYLEAAIYAHGRCFDFGPVFRAEKSKTRRHLTEFWMMDAEAAFVEHEGNMQIQEELVLHIIHRVLEKNEEELQVLKRDTAFLKGIQAPFLHVSYKEAVQQLHTLGSDIQEGEDLGNDDETLLTSALDRPLFIEKYPAAIKAFYMQPDAHNPQYALCDDMLAPEGYGEVIGGSQRVDDYDFLKKRIEEHRLPLEPFQWYLDLRKYGSVPHSGFGVGLERLVAWLCGLKHVRETIPFPRTLNRLLP